jgi:hypothetical protein
MEEKKPEDTSGGATPDGNGAGGPPKDALANPEAAANAASLAIGAASSPDGDSASGKSARKINPLKKFTKHFNVYFILFVIIILIAAVISFVAYSNSKKTPPATTANSEKLSQSQLKQLANSNATVGGSGQTLTVQSNAVFDNPVLIRSNLDVAGALQLGGTLNVSQVSVSGSSNLSTTQASTLQVAGTSVFQGLVTVQNGISVGGDSSLNTATIGTITANKLILSGTAQLQIPNHVGFSGSAAPRLSNQPALGGGSASISGSDTSGTISVNTGGGPQSGCLVNVSFNQAFYSSKPNVIISLISSSPMNLEYYAGSLNISGFSICSANAPPANQQFGFSYFITASTSQ